MNHPLLHAEQSATSWGGRPEDYLPVHTFFDEPASHLPDDRPRVILPNGFGFALAGQIGSIRSAGVMQRQPRFEAAGGGLERPDQGYVVERRPLFRIRADHRIPESAHIPLPRQRPPSGNGTPAPSPGHRGLAKRGVIRAVLVLVTQSGWLPQPTA